MGEQQTVSTAPWWKNKKIIIRIVILAVLIVIVFIATAYIFHWDLAGFINSPKKTVITEITRSPQEKVTTTEEGKTLWDWLQILGVLAIPIVVGFGTAFFTRQQAKTSEANTENQLQEELLRTYFDKISDLLLDKELSTNPNIQSIVRARTLAALHILNAERKAIVLRFLHDTGRLQHVRSFLYSLDLSHTDLNRIDLHGADLHGAFLRETDLFRAKLYGAKLYEANLSGADLSGADLSGANLSKANLSGANLIGTDLSKADLIEADLIEADLRGAKLSGADLSKANLIGAKLFRASITPEQLKEAKNITPEQLAQIKTSKSAAPQEVKAAQTFTTPAQSEIKPDQTSQEEAEQQTHTQPKQGTDASH